MSVPAPSMGTIHLRSQNGVYFHGRGEVNYMARPEWKAIFWDIGGVILDLDSVRTAHRAFISRLINEWDIAASTEEAISTWESVVGDYFRDREGTEFRPVRVAYGNAVEAIVGEPISPDVWQPLFREAKSNHLQPVPGAREVIERIDGTDLHQGVVSDVDDEEGRDILEQFGLLGSFDSITTSEGVGRTKPDPKMFEAALHAAGVSAMQAVMIGDRYSHDIEGATAHGLDAIAYGAAGGPSATYRISDLSEILELLGLDH